MFVWGAAALICTTKRLSLRDFAFSGTPTLHPVWGKFKALYEKRLLQVLDDCDAEVTAFMVCPSDSPMKRWNVEKWTWPMWFDDLHMVITMNIYPTNPTSSNNDLPVVTIQYYRICLLVTGRAGAPGRPAGPPRIISPPAAISMAMTRGSGPCSQRWRPARSFMLSSRSCALIIPGALAWGKGLHFKRAQGMVGIQGFSWGNDVELVDFHGGCRSFFDLSGYIVV